MQAIGVQSQGTPLYCMASRACGSREQGGCNQTPATQWQHLPEPVWIPRCPAPVETDPSSETASAPECLLHVQLNIREDACLGSCTACVHAAHGSTAVQAAGKSLSRCCLKPSKVSDMVQQELLRQQSRDQSPWIRQCQNPHIYAFRKSRPTLPSTPAPLGSSLLSTNGKVSQPPLSRPPGPPVLTNMAPTLRQGLGQLVDKGVHLDACCPDACAKLHTLLLLCWCVCDNDLPRLHLIHLHHHCALACTPGPRACRLHC